ncbi:cell division protein FtsA [Brucepastera parasyntrophica]|uniref:cell division protein FtsA n=1 Tax=Brucepastera parasyntrophica TaxID=2880008 RepID=UPI00210E9CA3|nr:cell division protein FtsA [Brucepastera parasyntrophica]ULQ60168.1 cell division protein FtsA [Brucepastera parasyntrophica]
MSDYVVGLDIGTSKVRAIIGEISDDGVFHVTGVGSSPSTGLRKGVVVNIENTVASISQAIETAEMMSGVEVTHCLIGVGGTHIEGINSRGVVAVSGRGRDNREIGKEDINRVIDAAKAIVIPMDRKMLHVVPQSYIVDDQKGIKDPRNMIGVRLEAEVHIITGSATSIKILENSVNRANLLIDAHMFNGLAAVKAVMTEEESELGSIMIDLGGGTTTVLVMAGGAPLYTAVLPVGGIQVTNDISIVKGISAETAEKIKVDEGCCWMPLIEENEEVLLPGVGGRPPLVIPRSEICEIIQPRMAEILTMVHEKIKGIIHSRPFSGNVVITGGGANLPGVVELASEIFDTQAIRIGFPGNYGGLTGDYRSPDYATVIGLFLTAYEQYSKQRTEQIHREYPAKTVSGRIKSWFKEFF